MWTFIFRLQAKRADQKLRIIIRVYPSAGHLKPVFFCYRANNVFSVDISSCILMTSMKLVRNVI